jgi:hypothetical protein
LPLECTSNATHDVRTGSVYAILLSRIVEFQDGYAGASSAIHDTHATVSSQSGGAFAIIDATSPLLLLTSPPLLPKYPFLSHANFVSSFTIRTKRTTPCRSTRCTTQPCDHIALMFVEIHFRLHFAIYKKAPITRSHLCSSGPVACVILDMNPALALDRLQEDLGDTCICGPRPGHPKPCSGKWRRSKKRKGNNGFASSSSSSSTSFAETGGARDGLKEDIADLHDRFTLLREEKRRLTATRVANLAMCNDCLKADRVPDVVEDLLKGYKEFAMRQEAQKELLQQHAAGPVRRWYLWIEAYFRLHFGTPWMTHTRETTLRALFPGEYVPEDGQQGQQEQQQPGYTTRSRYNLRSTPTRDLGFQTVTQRKVPASMPVAAGKSIPHHSPLLDRSRVNDLHRRQSMVQQQQQQRVPRRSPLEARVRRLEDWSRWLVIAIVVVSCLYAGYRLRRWNGANAFVVTTSARAWSFIVAVWIKVSARVCKVAEGMREGWNA